MISVGRGGRACGVFEESQSTPTPSIATASATASATCFFNCRLDPTRLPARPLPRPLPLSQPAQPLAGSNAPSTCSWLNQSTTRGSATCYNHLNQMPRQIRSYSAVYHRWRSFQQINQSTPNRIIVLLPRVRKPHHAVMVAIKRNLIIKLLTRRRQRCLSKEYGKKTRDRETPGWGQRGIKARIRN